MTRKIILVNTCYPSRIDGTNRSEDLFAVEYGEAEKVGKEIMEALALKGFSGNFASLLAARKEIEAHAGEILDVVEGRKDNFTLFGDMVYTLRERTLDEDLVTDREMSDLKNGDTIFVKYDTQKKDVGVYSVISAEEWAVCIPYFKSDGSGTLTFERYIPFVAKGAEGYLVDQAGVEIAGPFKYAMPIGGGFFIVQKPDGQKNVIYADGTVKIEAIKPNEPSNGYMEFEKDGKQGFFEPSSGVVSPLFDEVATIELGEPIKVKKEGRWGYLTEDFTFLSEEQLEAEDGLSDEIFWYGY